MVHIPNALHRATDLARGIRRAVGLIEPGEGVERLGETLVPTLDIYAQPEHALLRGDLLAWGTILVPAGAGRSIVQLRVDRDGWIAVPLYILTDVFCYIGRDTGAGAALASVVATSASEGQGTRDLRGDASNVARMYYQNGVALPAGAVPRLHTTAGVGTFSDALPVLQTNASLYVYAASDATAIRVSMAWRMHQLFAGESREAG